MFKPDHYEAIGRLVIACTALDALMTDLIRAVSYMDATTAKIIVHHQQFSSKVDTLKALLDALTADFGPYPPELPNAIDRAKHIYDFRNTIVHAAWLVGERGVSPVTQRITARGKLVEKRAHQPTDKIRRYADEAEQLADHFESLLNQIE